MALSSHCRSRWLRNLAVVWLKSKYCSYVQGKAEHYHRAADCQVVFACASSCGLLKKKNTLPYSSVVSQHKLKKITKNLRPKGEFQNSSSAPGRLFPTIIFRQDVDAAGLIIKHQIFGGDKHWIEFIPLV